VDHVNVTDLAAQLAEDGETEVEAMREVSFSLQVMRFEPGDEDPMHAHAEEEIYQVNAGRATLATEAESIEVGPGDVVHVGPGTDHQFTDIEDEFVTTVVYAPAEGSQEAE
jgi:quercetin dioxygenase-like cupin family protein